MSLRETILRLIPQPLRTALRVGRQRAKRLVERRSLLGDFAVAAGKTKILYAITPHSGLANVGDHAQAVAIRDWLTVEFPNLPVVEMDKAQVISELDVAKLRIGPEDLIFLHSGGNMGDRGIYSESARRAIIEAFPDHPIVSLPQTIYFSDTEEGRRELRRSADIYARHPRLLIMARDQVSYEFAHEHFPHCNLQLCPDFVLYLDDELSQRARRQERSDRVLLCLRNDPESILDAEDRGSIADAVPYACDTYDTTIPRSIPRANRRTELHQAVDHFSSHALVITDRMHGMIFSVLTRTPCIVLPTVDHKMRASYEWFRDVQGLAFLVDKAHLAEVAADLHGTQVEVPINWRERYFDGLGQKLLEEVTRD